MRMHVGHTCQEAKRMPLLRRSSDWLSNAGLFSDVFRPQGGIFGDEIAHYLDTLRQVEVDHFHALIAHKLRRAGKNTTLADDDFPNPKLHNRAGAEIARH